jgi:phosphatase NudJ
VVWPGNVTLLVVLTVVPHGDRFLIVEERDGSFYLPAGRVEPGEDLLAATVRETREEAGVDVVPRGLLGFDHTYRGERCRLRFCFVADPAPGTSLVAKTRPDEHSRAAHWLTRDEIRRRPLRDPEVNAWLDAFERRASLLPASAYAWFGVRPG